MVEQFKDFKDGVEVCFEKLNILVNDVNVLMTNCKGDSFLKNKCDDESTSGIQKIKEKLQFHLNNFKRKQMKCVFFGQTSNGKSSMINAILEESVLPSSDGRTTSCFITIDGCEDDIEYFKVGDDQEKHSIEELNEKANEISNTKLEFSSFIRLFWPKDRCRLLKDNVQLLDSPGVDFSKDNDKWIEQYCQESDVFVYVVNSVASINESERKFFRKVKGILVNPNIFIVMNKWDTCEEEGKSDKMEKVRKQHLETCKQFLCGDLKLACDHEKKTFFLSAKEQLDGPDPLRRHDSAYLGRVQKRKEEFDRFFLRLCEDMIENAVRTKCGPHLESCGGYLSDMKHILGELEKIKSGNGFPNQGEVLTNRINGCIKDTFRSIKVEIETEISDQASSFAMATINDFNSYEFNAISASAFVREKMAMSLCNLFESHIAKIGPKIKGIYSSYSQFQMPQDTLNGYLPQKLKDHQSNLESSLSSNLKKVNVSVQREYRNEEDKNKDDGTSSTIMKLAGVAGNIALPVMRFFPVAGLLTLAGSLVVQSGVFQGPDRTKDIINNIKYQTRTILIEYMNKCFDECENEIKGEMDELIKKFVADHTEASKILSSIPSLKERCQKIELEIETKIKNVREFKGGIQ